MVNVPGEPPGGFKLSGVSTGIHVHVWCGVRRQVRLAGIVITYAVLAAEVAAEVRSVIWAARVVIRMRK